MTLRILCVASLSYAAGATGPTAADPTWEPDAREYFGVVGSSEPQRYAKLPLEEFTRLGSSGVPFVVSDACADCPIKTWSCEELSKKFSGVKFRREYNRGDERNLETFGTTDWTRQKVKIKRAMGLPKDAPQYASFYSDLVKAWRSERERGWGDKSAVKKMEKTIKDASKPMYFMDPRNAREMAENPEFWLQPPETGSMAHLDEHCYSTIAVTLSGVKRWRFASIPAEPHPSGYFDGLVYDRGEWDPIFNFTTRPGEAVIFPPGMIHEGLSVGEDCVSSITYQFPIPAPVHYWRSFWPRVRRTKDMRGCHAMIRVWATLGDLSIKPRPFGKAEAYAKTLGKKLDTNGDGRFSLEEVLSRLQGDKNTAIDALRYHDVNADGHATLDEFAQSFAAWSAVDHKALEEGVIFRDDDEEEL